MVQAASDVESPLIAEGTTTETKRSSCAAGLGNLTKLLPSGTFFLYTFLNPILTDGGKCDTGHKYGASILFCICCFTTFFSWFTDSYVDSFGVTHYGIVTSNGLFPVTDSDSDSDSDSRFVDFSKYKLRAGDFVHALISMTVFALYALLNTNTVRCFYPSFESLQKTLVMVLPPIVGSIAGAAFVSFPNKRHGIGYPPRNPAPSS